MTTMTPDRKRALEKGRKAAQKQRDREAIARVRAYVKWTKAGGAMKDIPAIPSNSDFAKARAAGVVR